MAGLPPPVHPEPLLAPIYPEPYPTRDPSPLAARSEAAAKTTPGRAWLSVYTEQNLGLPGPDERIGSVNAQSVWVDGYRATDLARGRWASLPVGRHVVSFIPDPKSGFGPRQNVVVKLTPGARVRKQILLPFSSRANSSGADGLLAAVPLGSGRPSDPPVPITPAASAPRPIGWYTVSGWISVNTPGHKPLPVRASAQWVKVDGQPVPALALGRWARLPAGKHVVAFQPTPALGIGPKTWDIDLTPQAHLSQKIPFFTAPAPMMGPAPSPVGRLLVSGWLSVTPPGRKPQRVPVAAEWITVDGWPSAGLTHGQWVSLRAGRHVLVFQPVSGSGAAPTTRVISLAPQSRLNQLMSLHTAPLPATSPLRNP